MKENVLDVLMYLFENYYMDDETEVDPDRESLHVELLEAGFPHSEINKAFDWLEELARHRETTLPAPQTGRSIRLFTDRECERLDTECRGFLIFLEQMDILTPASRELVIDRIMALDTEEIDIGELKWVILMVLFNEPGHEAAYAWIEDLVFENLTGSIH
jgi:Smg protein